MLFRKLLGLMLLLILVTFGPATRSSAQDTGYLLAVNDQIQLRVVEWRPEIGTPQVWDGLTGQYKLDSAGQISVPLVGVIGASGRTTDEVAKEIADRIKRAVGLVDPPGTSVEIVAYNPVMVVGEVARPGAHPFTPGMQVAAAFALAGGEPDRLAADLRATTRASGAVSRAQEILARELAREARLLAERDGLTEVTFPETLGHPGGEIAEEQIKLTELSVFHSRRDQLQRDRDGLQDLQDLYSQEGVALETKRVTLEADNFLVTERFQQIEKLVQDNLVRTQTYIDIRRAMSDLQAQSLDVELAIYRAQAELSVVNRELESIQTLRTAEIAQQLADARAEITAQEREVATNLAVLGSYNSNAQTLTAQGISTRLKLELLSQGERAQREVSLDVPMKPGDILTVSRVPLDEVSSNRVSAPEFIAREPGALPRPPSFGARAPRE